MFCGNFFRQAWCDLGCNWALLGVKCVGGCKNHVLVIGYCWHIQLDFHEILWETALRISRYPIMKMTQDDMIQCDIGWSVASDQDAVQSGKS